MRIVIIGLLAFALAGGHAMASSELGFFELATSDLSRAKAFYGELFGWTFRATPSPDFIAIDGAGTPGGIMLDPSPTSGRPNAKVFFKVEALKTKLAQAEKLGAKITIPPVRVSPTRTVAEFRDLDQNILGMICEKRCSE